MTPLERLKAFGLPESDLEYWRRISEGLNEEGRKRGREARSAYASSSRDKARELYATLRRQRPNASLKALASEISQQLQAQRITKKNGEPYKASAIYRYLLEVNFLA